MIAESGPGTVGALAGRRRLARDVAVDPLQRDRRR